MKTAAMKNRNVLTHEFVEFIPDDLQEGRLYVSMRFATVVHKCCCGCGTEVVTPLSPTDWKLIFNGKTISLDPSIGNWSLDCQSHYWIRGNRARWSRQWSQAEIDAGRINDRLAKDRYHSKASEAFIDNSVNDNSRTNARPFILERLKTLFSWWRA
jgi:hypothetical protein